MRRSGPPHVFFFCVCVQVTNNTAKAEELLRLADEAEECVSSSQTDAASSHFVLLGSAEGAPLTRDPVRSSGPGRGVGLQGVLGIVSPFSDM